MAGKATVKRWRLGRESAPSRGGGARPALAGLPAAGLRWARFGRLTLCFRSRGCVGRGAQHRQVSHCAGGRCDKGGRIISAESAQRATRCECGAEDTAGRKALKTARGVVQLLPHCGASRHARSARALSHYLNHYLIRKVLRPGEIQKLSSSRSSMELSQHSVLWTHRGMRPRKSRMKNSTQRTGPAAIERL